MLLRRFYDPKLAQASYLIACGRSGDAIVIDPNRDAEQYVRAAETDGVRISFVTETHIHADFVSGSRELASRTGARLYLSGEGGHDWSYDFATSDGALLLRDGDTIDVGNIALAVMHTPGHTPEHLTFLVTDRAVADEPMGAITGDFVFVGDVGRPDLLERAAKVEGAMRAGARDLFMSLKRFAALPDWLQIWPGHGAGSACGKGISAVPHSSLGYERRFNWAFSIADEEEFVRQALEGQPEPPAYFAEMKRVNKRGPRVLGELVRPPRLEAADVASIVSSGAIVVDTRAAETFASHHIPGTLNIPLNKSFSTWAGSILPFDRELFLLIDDNVAERADEAARDLVMIGLDRITGYFGVDALKAWEERGRALETVPQTTVTELAAKLAVGEVQVVDVRGASEWDAGHLPGAPNLPLATLSARVSEIPRGRPVVVQCQSGARSAIAASLLRARGVDGVVNLKGGFAAWRAAGLPVDVPERQR
ncbi:MAG TPA: rhodanese-like domain-containing protein [Gemmatimonadaceae bacterium]|nr:rhodanese-like domain-containing protein [Gemmatimonadaceae bacterium]